MLKTGLLLKASIDFSRAEVWIWSNILSVLSLEDGAPEYEIYHTILVLIISMNRMFTIVLCFLLPIQGC